MPYKNKEQRHEYYENNKDRIKAREKMYREENYDLIQERRRKFRENNRDHECERDRKYREENKYLVWAKTTIRCHVRNGFFVIVKVYELAEMAKNTPRCPYCHEELLFGPKETGTLVLNSPTLDRRNNERILTVNNIDIICFRCNRIKGSMPQKAFIKLRKSRSLSSEHLYVT